MADICSHGALKNVACYYCQREDAGAPGPGPAVTAPVPTFSIPADGGGTQPITSEVAALKLEVQRLTEQLAETEAYLVNGAAHPLVGNHLRSLFREHGPLVFLKMGANTIKDLEAELAKLKGVARG